MTEVDVQGIQVDVCRGGCGGLWFDWLELKKVDEAHEEAGSALLEVERDPTRRVDTTQRRHCPRCGDVVMMRHFASVQRAVEVDECPRCGGFFLDHGELNAIRAQYATEEERRAAANELFVELFDADLEELHEESRDRRARARGLARMFRFLLPSYYIPGKQPWGAY
jgi:Zn-finger nucleic acid-binding protein